MRLNITRGDTVSFTLVFEDDNGDPLDLTDARVYFTAKKKLSDTDDEAVLKKDIVDIDEPEDGEVTVQLSAEETDLAPGKYLFDVEVVITDGYGTEEVSSSGVGILMIYDDVTKRTSDSS